MYKLKYDHIPKEWINGLPISNGRLAAMYHGDKNKDILSLNHEYLWRGKYKNRETQYAADKLPVLRELLKKRDYFRSTVYANLFFAGYGGDCNIASGRIDKILSSATAGMLVRAKWTFDDIERAGSITPLGELLVPEV